MATFWPNGTRNNRPGVTNAFGVVHERYSLKPWPGGGYRRWHTGDDTSGYTYNHAPAAGVVIFAGYDGSYGNTVVVRHDDGIRSRTAHGAPGGMLVGAGQRVSAGQRLMVQGTTGLSTGVHNHQEIIRPDGSFIAPMEWIAGRIAAENNGSAAGGGSTPFDPEEDDMFTDDDRSKLTAAMDAVTPGKEGVKFDGQTYKQAKQAADLARATLDAVARMEAVVVGDIDRAGGEMPGKTSLRAVIAWYDQNNIVLRKQITDATTAMTKSVVDALAKVPGVDPKVVQDAIAKAVNGSVLDPNVIGKAVAADLAKRLES